MAKNIDSFKQLTTRIGRLRIRRCGPTPAVTIFVAYAPKSSYEEEEVEAFYMDLEKFYREDHAFYKVIIGDFNAKVGPRRTYRGYFNIFEVANPRLSSGFTFIPLIRNFIIHCTDH
ncbi:hypothetical protein RB195_013597 [Necator americanus]|uniref:Endonuclease/exonuclease/phosphatase domain-containing protein n=1 Tax=Necator americanus TaxID=51031 RepID=A0ABR1DZ36_NECAM